MPATQHLPALPHDDISQVFDGVWFVKGQVKMPMLIPMKFSRSMTVVRGDDGALTVINSMRLTEAGHQALDALGPVKHVIRIAGFHGRDDGFYRDHYGAKIYAIKGQCYTRKMESDTPTPYMEPDVWLEEGDTLPIADASLKVLASCKPTEGLVLIGREGGILVSGDALQNTATPDHYTNFPAKMFMTKMGFFKPHNVGPGWLQFTKPESAEVRAILDLPFEHVLPGHGVPVIGEAKSKFQPSVHDAATTLMKP